MSLRAPIAIPVEIRASGRRVFRLAWNVGEDGLRLEAGSSFEPGRPVDVRFRIPDGEAFEVRAEVVGEGGDRDDGAPAYELAFIEPPGEARDALRRYVQERLELPA